MSAPRFDFEGGHLKLLILLLATLLLLTASISLGQSPGHTYASKPMDFDQQFWLWQMDHGRSPVDRQLVQERVAKTIQAEFYAQYSDFVNALNGCSKQLQVDALAGTREGQPMQCQTAQENVGQFNTQPGLAQVALPIYP